MSPKIPTVAFNNGHSAPIFSLGTWLSQPGEVRQAVTDALACGYRNFDCAYIYQNEKEIGEAITASIENDTIKRDDIFVTSKLWLTQFRKDLVIPALRKSISDLGVGYLDLYLLHWAMPMKEDSGDFPLMEDGSGKLSPSVDADYLETWAELEKAVGLGLVRSIGVSNFNIKQVDRLCSVAKIMPVANQVECHPYLNQRELIDHCKSKGITVQAYCPLGNPSHPSCDPSIPAIMKDPLVQSLAKKYSKNPGQILIRFQIQRGVVVMPKSTNKERIETNIQVFDFVMTDEEMASLEGLDRRGNIRYNNFSAASRHPNYPF